MCFSSGIEAPFTAYNKMYLMVLQTILLFIANFEYKQRLKWPRREIKCVEFGVVSD